MNVIECKFCGGSGRKWNMAAEGVVSCPNCDGSGNVPLGAPPKPDPQDLFKAALDADAYVCHEFTDGEHSIIVSSLVMDYSERHAGEDYDKVLAEATAALVVAWDTKDECPACGGSGGGPDPGNKCPTCHGGGGR